jgi:hypothetical protein
MMTKIVYTIPPSTWVAAVHLHINLRHATGRGHTVESVPD